MPKSIRIIVLLLIATCFITNSYAMTFSMAKTTDQDVLQYFPEKNVMQHCEMTKHDTVLHGKFDQSNCHKNPCCLAVLFEINSESNKEYFQAIDKSHPNYNHQLTIGVYHLPYRPPNHVSFS